MKQWREAELQSGVDRYGSVAAVDKAALLRWPSRVLYISLELAQALSQDILLSQMITLVLSNSKVYETDNGSLSGLGIS